jgi:hypothetical protein
MSAPLVSVLLPAYNAALTLPAALKSIQRQSQSDWECIVVDDGSTDATASRVREHARNDARFRLLTISHSGIVSALNAGLALCRGAFVARMDGDDLMRSRRLELQLRALQSDQGLSAVGCHVRLFPRRDLTPRRRDYESWLNAVSDASDVRREAFVECPVAHPALFCRAAVLREFAYRECGWPEDYDLVLRLIASGHAIGNVNQRLLLWRDSKTRLSRTDDVYSLARFVACKAHFLAHGFLARAPQYMLWGYGETGQTLARALERHGKLPRLIVELHPGRIGQRIRGARVIHPDELTGPFSLPLIVSVAGLSARSEIRERLAQSNYEEGRDFVCAA